MTSTLVVALVPAITAMLIVTMTYRDLPTPVTVPRSRAIMTNMRMTALVLVTITITIHMINSRL